MTDQTRRQYLHALSATAVGASALQPAAAAEVTPDDDRSLFDEDFEDIQAGQYPDSWSTSGNTDQQVVDTHASSGSKCLEQRGEPGGCWQAIANAPVGLPERGSVTVSGAVRPTDQGSYGCHDTQHGYLGFRTAEGSWSNGDATRFLVFKPDGTVQSRTGDSTELGTWTENEWTEFSFTYTVRDSDVELEYTVGGTESGPFTVDRLDYEDQLDYLKLGSGDFVTQWDDLAVARGTTPLEAQSGSSADNGGEDASDDSGGIPVLNQFGDTGQRVGLLAVVLGLLGAGGYGLARGDSSDRQRRAGNRGTDRDRQYDE